MMMKTFEIGDHVVAPPGTMVGVVVKVTPMPVTSTYAQTVRIRWSNGHVGRRAGQSLRKRK